MPEDIALWLRDRAEITDLVHLYAQAADAGDLETLVGCFAPAARLESANGIRNGIDEIRAAMSPAGLKAARAASAGLQFDKSTHQMSNIIVSLDGDHAHAESSATAFLVGPKHGQPMMVIRGLTYSDDFIRLADGWRISNRLHRAIWQFGPVPVGG